MKVFFHLTWEKWVQYPINECVAYKHLSKPYQEFTAATSTLAEPTTFAEASKEPR